MPSSNGTDKRPTGGTRNSSPFWNGRRPPRRGRTPSLATLPCPGRIGSGRRGKLADPTRDPGDRGGGGADRVPARAGGGGQCRAGLDSVCGGAAAVLLAP